MGLTEVRHSGLFYHEEVGFSLELCCVFPRAATEDIFVRGLKFMGFFSTAETVEHLQAVWAGEGYSEALSCESQLIS